MFIISRSLSLIVLAWNISLLEGEQHSTALNNLAASGGAMKNKAIFREAVAHIKRLIAKKRTLFPQDKRTIVSWEVDCRGDNLRITAAALAPPP